MCLESCAKNTVVSSARIITTARIMYEILFLKERLWTLKKITAFGLLYTKMR
jgi:hypothetical protein